MPTSVKMVACYTSLIGATILPEVRAFSGIARASLKTISPKLSVALIFLWLLSFYQEKESDFKLGEQNMNKEKNLFKRILLTEVRYVVYITIHILHPPISEAKSFHFLNNSLILFFIKRTVK